MTSIQNFTLHVSGLQCSACQHLIEETLHELEDVTQVRVSLKDETITFATFRNEDKDSLANYLTAKIQMHGYSVHAQKQDQSQKQSPREWMTAIIAVILLIFGYTVLESAGLTSLITTSDATLTTAFIVGLVASVSTCVAVVGGIVLSVSATYAHEGKGWRPQALFHTGRVFGFFLLGGLLGLLGEVMQIGFYGGAILGGIASIVMLFLGVHLLDITTKVRLFTVPKNISQSCRNVAHKTGTFAPLLLGASTFFLPCGFTQSMQIISLSSGSFLTGATTMLVFALGTLPVLALLSFGSLDLAKSKYRGTFFKSAGILVILFAIFNLHNTLVVLGFIQPLISF